eukprot:CAMPEP_0117753994 /NCGR_PEP_ID=MMETSP0947-20121206/12570_1 /TAXON_ID=44440 /ORGANISM="Chattonella subsalsa, Strain CCMP2191" /LENGTH=266 /DNA_ID=CAMNT_0005573009 /DNA_START=53 /DNA_END=853 /DNA_ORIENTATION=-
MENEIPAGSVVKDNGDIVIPATRRPDGTWRKERKVKAGYVPQEERKAFETRATKFNANKPKLPPGMAPSEEPKKSEGKGKNRRRKKKSTNCAPAGDADKGADPEKPYNPDPDKPPPPAPTGPDDPAKVLKRLKKKLRQVEELQVKVEAGLQPSHEQQDKLSNMQALKQSIAELEAGLTNDHEPVNQPPNNAEVKEGEAIPPSEETEDDAAKEKRVKAIKKKLRQIDDLIEKQKTGQDLSNEQLTKVARREPLLAELRKIAGIEICS